MAGVVPVGKYPLLNHKFVTPDGVEFLIRERKREAGKKPREYLCSIAVGGMYRFQYVSSLYPLEGKESLYRFDCGGLIYTLRIDGGAVVIEKEGGAPEKE